MNLLDTLDIDTTSAQGSLPPKPKRALLIPHPTIPDDYTIQLDNTTLTTFQQCPRSGMFYTINRRQRPDRAALIFGGAIHEALEVIYRDGFDAIDVGIKQMLKYFDAHPYSIVGEWRTPAYAVEAVRRYVSYWSLMEVITPISPEWVEKAFALNIGSFPVNAVLPYPASMITDSTSDSPLKVNTLHIQFTGKIDIGTTLDNGELIYVLDHKTTSMGGPTFYADFELAQQTHGYMWAMQEILGKPVAGFILNALLIRKPTKTGKGIEFDRRTFHYTQESITEWKDDVLQSMETYIHSLVNSAFPKCTAWCMGKYGKCQYHDVCTLPAAQRGIMLYSDQYANVSWSPLNK